MYKKKIIFEKKKVGFERMTKAFQQISNIPGSMGQSIGNMVPSTVGNFVGQNFNQNLPQYGQQGFPQPPLDNYQQGYSPNVQFQGGGGVSNVLNSFGFNK